MADTSIDEDESFDEGDELMLRSRRFPRISANNLKLDVLVPREIDWLKVPVGPTVNRNDRPISKPVRRHSSFHSSPHTEYPKTCSPLPIRKDFTKKLEAEKAGNESSDYEEGWKVKADGSFYYEDDERISESVTRVKHVYKEWQSRKNKKKGIAKYISDRVSGMTRIKNKICNPADKNLKLKIFLVVVSLLIIGGVSTTWHFYHKIVLQAFIGRGIRIIEEVRTLHLADVQGIDKLEGLIGQYIPEHLLPYDCRHVDKEASICLIWKYRAKLKIFKNYTSKKDGVQCFRMEWESYTEKHLKDCFYLGESSWYGVGETYPQIWPIQYWKKDRSPFVTGNVNENTFGSVLERYWLTTSGVSITVDNDVPLYMSVNEDEGKLCLESSFDGYPYKRTNDSHMPFLKYNLCAGTDVKTTHNYTIKRLWSQHLHDQDVETFSEYLSKPVWSTKSTPKLNDSSLLSLTHDIMQKGYGPGLLIIDSEWEEDFGDYYFSSFSFPSIQDTLITLRNKGFHVILSVSPYVSIKTSAFDNALANGYLVYDARQKMPLLTKWRSKAVATVDFTNPNAKEWMSENLQDIIDTYQLKGFSFVGGESLYLPDCYNMAVASVNPDVNSFEYRNFASHNGFDVSTISSSTFKSSPSDFLNCTTNILTLSPRRADWGNKGGLNSIIPSVLTYGLFGNTLINIGSVGGDDQTVAEKELYLRWMQVAIFMPVFQFSVAPSHYGVEEIASRMLKIRESIVVPIIQKYLEEAVKEGFPIIRPLWWIAPHDAQTYEIDDQFLVHDKIVVAPMLHRGKIRRDIYLPEGWWRDELKGAIVKGKKWIYKYTAGLGKVPHFLWLEGAQS